MKKLVSMVLVMVICLGVVASGHAEFRGYFDQETQESAYKAMKAFRDYYKEHPDKFTEAHAWALYEYYMMYNAAAYAYIAEVGVIGLDDVKDHLKNMMPSEIVVNRLIGDQMIRWLKGEIEMDDFMDLLISMVDSVIKAKES